MTFKRLDKKDYKNLMGTNGDSEINQNHLILHFLEFDFAPDLITQKLGLQPLSTGQKGEEYFIGPQKDIPRIWDCSHWDFEWKINTNDFIGDLVDKFFNEIIIPRIDTIKEIGLSCKMVRFTIVQYYYTGNNPGYGFEPEQLKILADIGAGIDVDIYCLGEDE
ncbi:DUF4279 domain-containing protein [Ancylomarina euxinus]|uniref:DUF4279 domain-containing protein n=3 Tax=Ancylomarina euxinus TaxID=2283627 RepID=A0A425XWF0_9BACT|nr:DUF4279 domain-containing protein [Ancylomarina euxinus]MUP16822.1 DUF4279 domain-containing protein [Ancylomarina euxinus]RRG18969.1 DUF4279 domain-containing protein [Ancylomarina euxinus]